MTMRDYVGMRLGCSACIYETSNGVRGIRNKVPDAVIEVETPRGLRQLCAVHAHAQVELLRLAPEGQVR